MPETLTAPLAESAGAVPMTEAIAQAIAAGAPVDRPLPGFEPPPYDAPAWNRRLASKQRAVLQAKAAWKAAAEKAAGLKKTWERETDEQDELYRVMDEERRRAEGELVQPSLGVAQGPGSSSCRHEQRTGQPCRVCILLRTSGSPLPDPEDTAHAELVAEALRTGTEVDEIAEWIARVCGQNLDDATVTAWTLEQRIEVQIWCAAMEQLEEGTGANAPARPALLGTPHVADVPGSSVQSCKRCRMVLRLMDLVGAEAWVEGALVGTDCEGVDAPAPDGSAEGLETALAEQKLCLCETPDFLVPADKDDATDARCTKCEGAPDGGTYKVRFAKPTKKGKR